MKKLITSLYSITYIIIYISVLTAFSSKSLEITVPVTIYQNLSKTISNPLIGSSNLFPLIKSEKICKKKWLTCCK